MKKTEFDYDKALKTVSEGIRLREAKALDEYARGFDLSEKELEEGLERLHEQLVKKVDFYILPQFVDGNVKAEEGVKLAGNFITKFGALMSVAAIGTAIAIPFFAPAAIFTAGLGGVGVWNLTAGNYMKKSQKEYEEYRQELKDAWEEARKDLFTTLDFCKYNDLNFELSKAEPFKIGDLIDKRKDKSNLKNPFASDRIESVYSEHLKEQGSRVRTIEENNIANAENNNEENKEENKDGEQGE